MSKIYPLALFIVFSIVSFGDDACQVERPLPSLIEHFGEEAGVATMLDIERYTERNKLAMLELDVTGDGALEIFLAVPGAGGQGQLFMHVYSPSGQENQFRYLGMIPLSPRFFRFERDTKRMVKMAPTPDHTAQFASYIFDHKGIHCLERRDFKSNDEFQREPEMMRSWSASTSTYLWAASFKDIRVSLEKTKGTQKIHWQAYFAKETRVQDVNFLRGKVTSSAKEYDRFGLYTE